MQIRRIVTGHDLSGQAVFVADGAARRATDFVDIPGHGMAQLWATSCPPRLSETPEDLTQLQGSLIPGVGETSLLAVSFPPDSVMASPVDPQRAFNEMAVALPGLFDCFEAEHPGMHKTPTIDYGVLLEGELWLELDNGEQRVIRPGDVVIQNGTRHAWRNKSQHSAKAIFFMVGASNR
ncbi:Cupin domain protein [compost metagenome]